MTCAIKNRLFMNSVIYIRGTKCIRRCAYIVRLLACIIIIRMLIRSCVSVDTVIPSICASFFCPCPLSNKGSRFSERFDISDLADVTRAVTSTRSRNYRGASLTPFIRLSSSPSYNLLRGTEKART